MGNLINIDERRYQLTIQGISAVSVNHQLPTLTESHASRLSDRQDTTFLTVIVVYDSTRRSEYRSLE